jgi:hypothetical protein
MTAASGLFLLGLATGQSSASAASLLVNGGFDVPVQGPPNFAAFNIPAGSTYITGWTVVQGNVDLSNTCCYGPGPNSLHPSSLQDVDLIGDTRGSGGVKGGLSQSFATITGQTYRLAFDYSQNNGTFSPDYAVQVTVADANTLNTVFSVEVSQAHSSQPFGLVPWQAFSQDFTAISDLTLLKFIDTRGAFNAGIYLDEVSVEAVNAVPLPAALPLFASGLGGFGLMGWWRKRRRGQAVHA